LTGKKIELPVGEEKTLGNLRCYAAYHLYPLVKEYIERRKSFDKIFIQKTFHLFKRFEGL